MTASWRVIVDELRVTQFVDIEGAEAALVLPVSDELITRLAREHLLPRAPIRDLDIRADGDDGLTVRFRVKAPAFLPPFNVRLAILDQPQVPRQAVLVLRLQSQGLAALAGSLSRLLKGLPPWLVLDGDRLMIGLEPLLQSLGAPDVLPYLSLLELHTLSRRFVLTVRGGIAGPVRVVDRTEPGVD